MRAFLHHAVHLQLFKQFIDSRLEKLNAGEGFSDIFEQEITNSGFSAGNMRSYQLWMDSLKKGGGAFISTMRNKTNPAVRNMYRYAKGQAKIGLKGMRSRLMYKELSANPHLQRGNSLYSDQLSGPTLPRSSQSECLQSRLPITQHFGKSRPRRPNKRPSGTEPEAESSVDSDDPQEPDPFSNTGGDLDPSFLEPGELDLLGEIFETLSLSAPGHAGGMLYGTRSLDFASLHEGSCYARLHPSEETLSTLLLEGLEEEDSLSLEETSLPRSPAQEDFGMPPQPASHLPAKVTQRGSGMWDGGIQEREEEEEVAAAAAPPPLQMRAEELEAPTSPTTPQGKDAQITDSPGSPETSEPGERETESCSAAEAGQGAPGAPSRAGVQSSRRPLRASAGTNPDTGAGAAADPPNSLPALPKVSELRKRFEA
uniref:DENN domain-containing protein 1C n=1 Tax=Sphenodon punctatus TaxID=8508 RepID=A0A8D0HN51_SPHPU